MTQVPSYGQRLDPNNYCYRHPDRQSFVLCQRCGRTICPECQTQAAVGVICPECMKEQRASAPRVKPAVVTRIASGRTPIVTYVLIGICVAVYILQSIPGVGSQVSNALQYAGLYSQPALSGTFQPWRMITAIFAHGSIIHLLFNVYTLWLFGRLLEPMLGRFRYLTLFLLSGIAGSLGMLFIAPSNQGGIGASGAIFGLMAAYVVIQRRLGGDMTQLLILMGINFVIGFIPQLGIGWQAHLGGLIGGALVGLIFVGTSKPTQQPLQTGLLGALTVVFAVLTCVYLFV